MKSPTKPKQETVLEEAARITAVDREQSYDHPLTNHERIAGLWNAYLQARPDQSAPLSPGEVVHMMILLKLARDVFRAAPPSATMHPDGQCAICGYARCLERIRAASGDSAYVDA